MYLDETCLETMDSEVLWKMSNDGGPFEVSYETSLQVYQCAQCVFVDTYVYIWVHSQGVTHNTY